MTARRVGHGWALTLLFAGSGACYTGLSATGDGASLDDGADGGDGTTGAEPAGPCGAAVPGPSPIRRLTAYEYDNTIEDLLGDATRPARDFPQEGGSGFDNNADVSSVSRLLAEKYMRAAEGIAARATEDLVGLLGCDPSIDESACVRAWIAGFGARAWRRPLAEDEVAAMMDVFDGARATGDVRQATSLVLEAFLQSPYFMYRVEFGAPGAGAVVELSDHEMASRLSYFLWASMPDDALFAAAGRGELHTREQVEAQARRMLEHPRARAMVLHFHRQWLDYGDIDGLEKDPTAFPDYTPEIAAAQRAAIEAFVDHVIWEGDGTLATLLSAPYTFVDAALADYYGLPQPAGEGMQLVTPYDRDVAGVLTQGAILAVQARSGETHPIRRGLFVREQLLCTIPPPPPPDLNVSPPAPDPNATTRTRYEQHRDDPACSGCHKLMDPIGFGLENFDGTGRWRLTENGLEIDASGEFTGTDVDGTFVGAVELGERLAASKRVSDCVSTQWFRFAYGRTENPEVDACTISDLQARFDAADHDVRELLVALTQTDAFMFRPAAAEGE